MLDFWFEITKYVSIIGISSVVLCNIIFWCIYAQCIDNNHVGRQLSKDEHHLINQFEPKPTNYETKI